MKHTEKTIIKALNSYFDSGYKYQIQNAFIYNWECDFFCVSNKGYAIEFEAKISRNDFLNDFKKEKHADIKREIDSFPVRRKLLPNRFYYAVPTGMITPNEVPPYAGLIYVDTFATIVKNAPLIHKRIYDYRRILCDKFYFRMREVQRQLRIAKYDNNQMQEMLDKIKEQYPKEYHSLYFV